MLNTKSQSNSHLFNALSGTNCLFFFLLPAYPHVICYVETEDEVQAIVRICSKYKIPIVPYGSGTSLEGHTLAPR